MGPVHSQQSLLSPGQRVPRLRWLDTERTKCAPIRASPLQTRGVSITHHTRIVRRCLRSGKENKRMRRWSSQKPSQTSHLEGTLLLIWTKKVFFFHCMIWQKGGNLGVLTFFFFSMRKMKDWGCLVLGLECREGLESAQLWRPGLGQRVQRRVHIQEGGGEQEQDLAPVRDPQGRSQFLSGAILPCLHLALRWGRIFGTCSSRFTPVQARVGMEAVRTGHFWASWILGFLWNTDARGFSASFSNIAMLPISLVTFSRSHQRCMLPPSLIALYCIFTYSCYIPGNCPIFCSLISLFSSI